MRSCQICQVWCKVWICLPESQSGGGRCLGDLEIWVFATWCEKTHSNLGFKNTGNSKDSKVNCCWAEASWSILVFTTSNSSEQQSSLLICASPFWSCLAWQQGGSSFLGAESSHSWSTFTKTEANAPSISQKCLWIGIPTCEASWRAIKNTIASDFTM